MKNVFKLIAGAVLLAAFLLVASNLSAQEGAALAVDAAVTAPAPSVAAQPDVIADTVAGLVAKYPLITTALMLIGAFRTVFKPLVSWYEARVAATADPIDDARLAKWKTSWWFRLLAWALDFTASIKVGPQR